MWKPLLVFVVVANTFNIFIKCSEVSNGDAGHDGDSTPACEVNEVYSTCCNGGCRRWNCSDSGILCIDPLTCEGGCVCQENYSRNYDGNCIPTDQCVQCDKVNEYYDTCAPTCPPQTCESIGKIYNCPIQPAVCQGACRCKKGFYRNKVGECILEADCKKCNKSNEYYDTCAPKCPPQTCDSIGKIYHCPLQPAVCTGACRCEKGYYRNDAGECISEEECSRQCPKGEVYEECPDNLCRPLTCSQLGYPLNCTFSSDNSNASCPGKPGCVCDNNNVRDRNGNCVPREQCPSCGGDPNAHAGCGVNCGRLCSNYKSKNVFCPLICNENGCDCNEGFVFDSNVKKCVCPSECTPTCGINEVYNECANGGCRKRKCSQPIICVSPKKCEGGCICTDGYTRAENGTCIPENECPEQCNRPHEYYDDCAPICPLQTCDSIGIIYLCPAEPAVCKGACRCEDGYYRNNKGECIPKRQCKSCGGDPNAIPGCGINCGRLCSNYNKGPVRCPKICKANACDCKRGFVLDENINRCVLPEECTPVCEENEVYSSCVNGGCQRKKCSQLGKRVLCKKINPDCCIKGCLCKEKYLRADNGTCVPEEYCEVSTEVVGNEASSTEVNKTDAKARLDKGSAALSGEFLYQLSQSRPNENFVTSATSVLIPLAQLALFAKDLVLQQLLTVLNLKSKEEIKSIFPDETENYNSQKFVEFELATKYFANENYPLTSTFEDESKTYFNAGAENVDFNNNQQAADTINDWVSEQTKGKIQNLVEASSLNADTVMVLVNAIYFFGNWTHQFNENSTEKRDFTTRNKTVVQLDTMYQENNFNYAKNNDMKLQALELPYKGGNFSFLVILPEEDYFDETIQALRDPNVFNDIINSMSNVKVRVYLPKMDIKTNMDIAEMLQKDNVTEIFNPKADGFEGILQTYQPLYVSAAVQKAMIQVNERGTEAAAATALVVGVAAALTPTQVYTFNANHSYIFYLLCEGVPIFTGAFVGAE